jgi:hypothetical protein
MCVKNITIVMRQKLRARDVHLARLTSVSTRTVKLEMMKRTEIASVTTSMGTSKLTIVLQLVEDFATRTIRTGAL